MAPDTVTLDMAGTPVPARLGETVAAALTRAGVLTLRRASDGSGRGLFCGMGVCQECAVPIDGTVQRACMTRVARPHRIGPGPIPPAPLPPVELDDLPVLTPDVLVVGGGAAGLAAAAAAAEAGAQVVLLDERTRLGGQYYKQPAPGAETRNDAQFAGGRALVARAERAGVGLQSGSSVLAAFPGRELLVAHPAGIALYRPAALVVATGAYERALPLPGWTLPGVVTLGAAQTLLRGEGVAVGPRVLVAGHGPLGLQVAVELAQHGARVAAVAELGPLPGLRHAGALGRMAASTPGLLWQGVALRLRAARLGIPVLHEHVLASVAAIPGGLHAQLATVPGKAPAAAFEVDAVCTGYGFTASNELLRSLDCRHRFDTVRHQLVTELGLDGATSIPGVFAAGDCCGPGGARAAVETGLIAGAAAAAHAGRPARPNAAATRRLRRHRRFQDGLWRLYGGSLPADALAAEDTVVCRCELVTLGAIRAALAAGEESVAAVKRLTRAGMGNCQGRYCAPVVAALAARRSGQPLHELAFSAPRAPIAPISIAALSQPLRPVP